MCREYYLWSLTYEFLLLIQLKGIVGNDYKFCSSDQQSLYSFNSEACPGGVFLKEPLEIDPSCYCHDTDLQIYNYCNVDYPYLLITHSSSTSPNGCQKDLVPTGKTRPTNYNNIRMMILVDEKSNSVGSVGCRLPCLENAAEVYTVNRDFGKGVRFGNAVEEQVQPNLINGDKVFGISDGNLLKNMKNASELMFEERLTPLNESNIVKQNLNLNVSTLNESDTTTGEDVLHQNQEMVIENVKEQPGTDDLPSKLLVVREVETQKVSLTSNDNGVTEGSINDNSLISKLDDTLPLFPMTYSEADKNFLTKILSEISDYLSLSSHHPETKLQLQSNVFKLIRKIVTIYEDLVPNLLIENGLLDDIFDIFHYTFSDVDKNPSTDRHMNLGTFKKVIQTLERCTTTSELKLVMDTSCPPQIIRVYISTGDDEYQEAVDIQNLTLPQDRQFQDHEDFIIGTIWKIFDTVLAECAQNFVDDNNVNGQHYFSTVIVDIFRRIEIQTMWFQGLGVELYQGLLKHKNLKSIVKAIDNIDIATHIRSNRWKIFLKKPRRTEIKEPMSRNRVDTQSKIMNPTDVVVPETLLHRGKRSPLIKHFLNTKAYVEHVQLPKTLIHDHDSDESYEDNENNTTIRSNLKFVKSNEESSTVSTTVDIIEDTLVNDPETEAEVITLTSSQDNITHYDAYLIWGGRAYCLQKQRTNQSSSLNVYPPIDKLCETFRHKCQAPVSDKNILQDGDMFDGCRNKGWGNFFLRSSTSAERKLQDLNHLIVCCYDGSKCNPTDKDNCEEKCKEYCNSIGGDPEAEKYVRDRKCLCSTELLTRHRYLTMLTTQVEQYTTVSPTTTGVSNSETDHNIITEETVTPGYKKRGDYSEIIYDTPKESTDRIKMAEILYDTADRITVI